MFGTRKSMFTFFGNATFDRTFLAAVACSLCCSCSTNGPDTLVDTDSQTEVTDPQKTDPQKSVGTEEVGARKHDGQVLRHAVFFSFKEDSSESDVQSVVDAFRALPAKIDVITEFQSGVNNSPEDHDDGFTHCFLLTFDNEAGREVYIPHPEHSGTFADALRPHMDKVFVFDYWGEPCDAMEKELKHAVFFKFQDDAAAEGIKKVEDAFAALPAKINTIKQFEWGMNNSPEGKADGFTHCFMVTFDSDEGRAEYLPHADHKAFVEVLLPVLDKVRVLDFYGERVE